MIKQRKDNIFAFFFILPVFAVYTCFLIVPMISSAFYSLNEWNGVADKIFIGMGNYKTLIASSDYWITFWNTLKLVIVTLAAQISLGLLIAYLLYNKMKGLKIFRTIYFLPVVIAPVAIGLMFSLFYNSEIGIFNRLLEAVGLDSWNKNWLSDQGVLLGAVIAPQAWQYIGMYITIFIAALQSVPEELVESAQIDGANNRQRFFHIIVPQMGYFIEISMILCVTGALKSFDHSWIMTNGGPGVRSAYLGVYMYKTAFVNSDFGLGSAISVTIVSLALIFTLVLKAITGRINKE